MPWADDWPDGMTGVEEPVQQSHAVQVNRSCQGKVVPQGLPIPDYEGELHANQPSELLVILPAITLQNQYV